MRQPVTSARICIQRRLYTPPPAAASISVDTPSSRRARSRMQASSSAVPSSTARARCAPPVSGAQPDKGGARLRVAVWRTAPVEEGQVQQFPRRIRRAVQQALELAIGDFGVAQDAAQPLQRAARSIDPAHPVAETGSDVQPEGETGAVILFVQGALRESAHQGFGRAQQVIHQTAAHTPMEQTRRQRGADMVVPGDDYLGAEKGGGDGSPGATQASGEVWLRAGWRCVNVCLSAWRPRWE